MKDRINLLEGNILSALTRLALPIMGMSLLQMAYNLTDMFWIGQLGAGAVASVGTGGLILWLAMGIHMLAQIGGQVYVGQNLGANNKTLAGKYAHSSLFMSVVISIILGFAFFVFAKDIVAFFRLNDAQVISDSIFYIQITAGFGFFSLVGKMLAALITVSGNSKTPFYATVLGLGFNIILDPILIFGYFNFPELGVAGAALATVLAQFIVFLVLLIYALKDKHLFSYISILKLPSFALCKDIIKLSFPVMIQNTLMPLISMYVSRLVAVFGDEAIAVQRVGSQVESISWMVSEGFGVAVNSFIAQNYGANNIERAKQGFNKALKLLVVYGLFSSTLLIVGARFLFSVFLDDPNILSMGENYLQILGLSQIFMCIEILSSTSLNAFGKSIFPAITAMTFNILRIPMAITLSATVLQLSGIWWSITISSVLKGIFMLIGALYFFKKLQPKHKDVSD